MVDEPLAPSPDGVDEDAWLAACAAVRAYCGWHVAPVVIEEVTVDGTDGPLVFLPTLRLLDVLSITDDGTAVDLPVEWTRYGAVKRSTYGYYYWTYKMNAIVAEIEHGYEECPLDLFTVIREMVNASELVGVSQVTSGQHSFRIEGSPTSTQRAVLDRYRIVRVS